MTRQAWLACCVVMAACATGPARPVEPDLGADACAHCRMVIVSKATAAEIVAPGEEPVLFDEIGCLRNYVAHTSLPDQAIVYVADHRTGAWAEAASAIFTHTTVATPMASGLLAHADAASRDADPAARGGEDVAAAAILGAWPREDRP